MKEAILIIIRIVLLVIVSAGHLIKFCITTVWIVPVELINEFLQGNDFKSKKRRFNEIMETCYEGDRISEFIDWLMNK